MQVLPLKEASPLSLRFVMVTATIPEATFGAMESEFGRLYPALGPGLHCTAPGATEELIDCSGGDEVRSRHAICEERVVPW